MVWRESLAGIRPACSLRSVVAKARHTCEGGASSVSNYCLVLLSCLLGTIVTLILGTFAGMKKQIPGTFYITTSNTSAAITSGGLNPPLIDNCPFRGLRRMCSCYVYIASVIIICHPTLCSTTSNVDRFTNPESCAAVKQAGFPKYYMRTPR